MAHDKKASVGNLCDESIVHGGAEKGQLWKIGGIGLRRMQR